MEPNVPISLDSFSYKTQSGGKKKQKTKTKKKTPSFLIILTMHLKFTLNITQEPECRK